MSILEYMPFHVNAGMSFSSNFFYKHIQTKYNKETFENPMKRLEMAKIQGQFIRKKFPKYFFNQDPEKYNPNPSLGIGVCTYPKIWGCDIQYRDNIDPMALPLLKPDEDPMSLKVPELYDNMQWLLEEIDVFTEHGYSKNSIGMPNIQSPLNIAIRLVGETRLLTLLARKSKENVAKHIMEVSSDLFIDATKEIRKNLGKPLKSRWTIAGCTYHYLSPKQWTKFILPIVYKCEELGPIYFHHCGVVNTEKVAAFAEYPAWQGGDLGFGSDYKLIRKLFKNPKIGPLPFSCRISPFRMLNQSAEEIKKDVELILDGIKGGPASINVVGIPYQTPQANLDALFDACQEYNKKKEEEDMDDDD